MAPRIERSVPGLFVCRKEFFLKVYLSVPYTGMEEESFRQVTSKAAELVSQGLIVFSPISHTHHMGKMKSLPVTWDFWKVQDEAFITWADELWVFCIDGWKRSVGVAAEMDLARKLGKPVKFVYP
jgi:hypothetical protein